MELKLRVSRAVENEGVLPRALKGTLVRHYLRGLPANPDLRSHVLRSISKDQGKQDGDKASSRELLGTAGPLLSWWSHRAKPVPAAPGTGREWQIVAEMSPNPANRAGKEHDLPTAR